MIPVTCIIENDSLKEAFNKFEWPTMLHSVPLIGTKIRGSTGGYSVLDLDVLGVIHLEARVILIVGKK